MEWVECSTYHGVAKEKSGEIKERMRNELAVCRFQFRFITWGTIYQTTVI
jgi:hypothetical protein